MHLIFYRRIIGTLALNFLMLFLSATSSGGRSLFPEITDNNKFSYYDKPVNFSAYTSWYEFPVFKPTGASLNNLFRRQILNPKLPKLDYNIWLAVSSLARTYPLAGMVLLSPPSLQNTYEGVPWQPRPRIAVDMPDGRIVDYLGADVSGNVVPFNVVDVWNKNSLGTYWGLLSTGAMKDTSNWFTPLPGATASSWGGPLWPPESVFTSMLAILPTIMPLPQSIGVVQNLPIAIPGRATDNWGEVGVSAASLGSINYVAKPCNFSTQAQLSAWIKVPSLSNYGSVNTVINGIYRVDLGGNLGTRWLLVYTNAEDYSKKSAGFAEYFGLDAGTADQYPGASRYGQIFYGQEEFDKNGSLVNWSAALWNKLTPRTGGGEIATCPGNEASVDIHLIPSITTKNATNWVDHLYQSALGRPVDSIGLN